MIDIIHNVLGWIVITTFAIVLLYIFTLISWKCCEDCIIKKAKNLFLYLSGFMFNLSAMPLITIQKHYEVKYFFENLVTILAVFCLIESISLLKVIIEKNGN